MSAAPAVIRMVNETEARRLTSNIRRVIESIDTSYENLLDLIGEAQNSNTWQVMGHPSWAAYLASLFDGRQVALPREDRKALTTLLSRQGMSVRAIAPIVGVSREQVRIDSAGDNNLSPESATATTASLDGKTYPRRVEPTKPRRRPLNDQAQDAAWKVLKAAENLEAIAKDDRFDTNATVMSDLVFPAVARAGSIVAHFEKCLSIGRAEAMQESLQTHRGIAVAIGAVSTMFDLSEITPEQAVDALDHLTPVMQKLKERAES